MCLPCVSAVTVEVQSARGEIKYFLFGSSSHIWSVGGNDGSCSFTAAASPLFLSGRVIASDNGHDDREKVVFVERVSYWMHIFENWKKIDRNEKLYWPANRFPADPKLPHYNRLGIPNYAISYGSPSILMSALFCIFPLGIILSLSLTASIHQLLFLSLMCAVYLYLHVQVPQHNWPLMPSVPEWIL
jgi:hypothetical protein